MVWLATTWKQSLLRPYADYCSYAYGRVWWERFVGNAFFKYPFSWSPVLRRTRSKFSKLIPGIVFRMHRSNTRVPQKYSLPASRPAPTPRRWAPTWSHLSWLKSHLRSLMCGITYSIRAAVLALFTRLEALEQDARAKYPSVRRSVTLDNQVDFVRPRISELKIGLFPTLPHDRNFI